MKAFLLEYNVENLSQFRTTELRKIAASHCLITTLPGGRTMRRDDLVRILKQHKQQRS